MARKLTAVVALAVALASGCGSPSGDDGASPPNNRTADRGNDFIGIYADDVYFGDAPYRRKALARQRAAGIELIRQPFSWTDFAKDQSAYDGFVGAAARAGMRVLPVVLGPEPGTGAGRGGMTPPSSDAAFAQFAVALVKRYGPRGSFWRANPSVPATPITSWQIWNEPNIPAFWAGGPDPAAYARLLVTASRAIRRTDPSAEIVTAGLSTSHMGIAAARFLAGIYRAGAKGSFDSVGIHSYAPTPRAVVALADAAAAVIRRNGDDAKLWITEVGWGTGGKPGPLTVSPPEQADYIASTVRDVRARKAALNLRGIVLFQWRDPKPYPGRRDIWPFHAGLLDETGRPKPSLTALQAALR
jgi:polysaccharide biosynthesis protein PslG